VVELDYITVKGFRSIKSLEKLELRPINVLVGANGSGKSNFLEVFAFLNAIGRGHSVEYADKRGGADNIFHFGFKETKAIEIEVSFPKGRNGYQVNLSRTDDDRFFFRQEAYWYWNKEKRKHLYQELEGPSKESAISEADNKTVPKWLRTRLEGFRLYHLHDTSDTSPMKKTADLDDNLFLRPDGSNLSAYLYYVLNYHFSAFQMIRKTVQRVAPFFDNFQLTPLRRNETKIRLAWTHKSSDRYFDASALSDGTLRFICLATLFLQPADCRPSIIFVDEPELGLHRVCIHLPLPCLRT
jgi:predicted ATPase